MCCSREARSRGPGVARRAALPVVTAHSAVVLYSIGDLLFCVNLAVEVQVHSGSFVCSVRHFIRSAPIAARQVASRLKTRYTTAAVHVTHECVGHDLSSWQHPWPADEDACGRNSVH